MGSVTSKREKGGEGALCEYYRKIIGAFFFNSTYMYIDLLPNQMQHHVAISL